MEELKALKLTGGEDILKKVGFIAVGFFLILFFS